MSTIQLTVTYASKFGSEGTGNGQLKYPGGIVILQDEIYVCDTQNNRIQVFDLAGTYVRQFGTAEVSFPDGITTNGIDIFVSSSASHVICWYNPDGTLVWGIYGQNQVDYPAELKMIGDTFVIANRQLNKVTLLPRAAGVVRSTPINDLLLPEGVEVFNNFIVAIDSGNHSVKVYDAALVLKLTLNQTYDYPVGCAKINDDCLAVVDMTGNCIKFYDEQFNYISSSGSEGTGDGEFYFPRRAYYYDSKLYVVDSGNHRIQVFTVAISRTIPDNTDRLTVLAERLYPTGRAFNLNGVKYWRKLHEALAISEARALEQAALLLSSIIPDNSSFSEDDAERWEAVFGLTAGQLDLAARKAIILFYMSFPENYLYRQSGKYITKRLTDAGFTGLIVVKNEFTVDPGTFGTYTILANSLDENEDSDFISSQVTPPIALSDQLGMTWVCCKSNTTWPTFVARGSVDVDRKKEFRELLLRLVPAHTIGFLYIDYE